MNRMHATGYGPRTTGYWLVEVSVVARRRVSQALVMLLVLQGVVAVTLRRDDVRRHLTWRVMTTPLVGGRMLVLQLHPVSLVEQGSGPALLDTDAWQEHYALPHPAPTALYVTVWAPDQHQQTPGLLVDVLVPLDVLMEVPIGMVGIVLALVRCRLPAKGKRGDRHPPPTS